MVNSIWFVPEGKYSIVLLIMQKIEKKYQRQFITSPHHFPSEQFEKTYSIIGISRKWQMPEGYDAKKFGNKLVDNGWLMALLQKEKQNTDPMTRYSQSNRFPYIRLTILFCFIVFLSKNFLRKLFGNTIYPLLSSLS